MKKMFLLTLVAMISGFLLGKFTFGKYEKINETLNATKEASYIYMINYGSYDNKDKMINELKEIDKYIYSYENNMYNAYIGITGNMNNAQKIKNIYNNSNLQIQKIYISNDNFIKKLKNYDKLIAATEDNNSLIILQKQILILYEDMVIKNE